MTPHSMWEGLARPAGTQNLCVNRLIQCWAQVPEAGQAKRKQLRRWKPTRERAAGRADFVGV